MTDTIDPQFVSNAARNIEKATWMLSQRQGANAGELLLFFPMRFRRRAAI